MAKESIKDRIIVFICFAIFFALGMALFIYGIRTTTERNAKMKYFERVVGSVTDHDYNPGDSESEPSYTAIFTYEIGGVEYTCKDNMKYISPLPKGTREFILYDPSNPADSFVEKDASTEAKLMIIFGAVTVGASLEIPLMRRGGRAAHLLAGVIFGAIFIAVGFAPLLLQPGKTILLLSIGVFGSVGLFIVIRSVYVFLTRPY